MGKQYSLNIGGGEIMASIGDNPLEIAGRFSMVIPDAGMQGTWSPINNKGETSGGLRPDLRERPDL